MTESDAHGRIPEAQPLDTDSIFSVRVGTDHAEAVSDPSACSDVAQLAEHPAVNRAVGGSSPPVGAIHTLEHLLRGAQANAYEWVEMNRPLPLI